MSLQSFPAAILFFPSAIFVFSCGVTFFRSFSPSLVLLADSDASRDSTQPDSAGARRPGQPGFLRLRRKSGNHVGVGSPHRLQPDEPAASEPAAGTLVQPGQAEGTRSEVNTQLCWFHHLHSESPKTMLITKMRYHLLPPSGWLQCCSETPSAPCDRLDINTATFINTFSHCSSVNGGLPILTH